MKSIKRKTVIVLCLLGIFLIFVYAGQNHISNELYQPASQSNVPKEILRQNDLLERLQTQINKLDGIDCTAIIMGEDESVLVKITLDDATKPMSPDEAALKKYVQEFTQKQNVSIVIDNNQSV